jgi:hypothetical protein
MKKSWHLRKGGQGLQKTEENYEQSTGMSKSSELRNYCTITKFRFRLRKNNYEFPNIRQNLKGMTQRFWFVLTMMISIRQIMEQ